MSERPRKPEQSGDTACIVVRSGRAWNRVEMSAQNQNSVRKSFSCLVRHDIPVGFPLPLEMVLFDVQTYLQKFFLNVLRCLLQSEIAFIGAPVKIDSFHVSFEVLGRNHPLLIRHPAVLDHQKRQREDEEKC